MKGFWLKSITAEQIANIKILDWLEGYGQVMSFAEIAFIQRYGHLLLTLRAENKRLKDRN